MTRKWILPLTYAPKIPAVLDGRCTQTIRPGRKFRARDLIMFHGWEGRPYHSKWSFRTPYWELHMAWPILILPDGFVSGGDLYKWPGQACTGLSERDGIDPPTGQELGRVLLSMHKIPPEGLEAQIIRWRL